MSFKSLVALLVAAGALSACYYEVRPGKEQTDPPPRIVTDKDKRNVWSNAGNFGPVPANLKENGDKICKGAGMDRAVGYHAKAEGLDGKAFQGGGYFCVDKDYKD